MSAELLISSSYEAADLHGKQLVTPPRSSYPPRVWDPPMAKFLTLNVNGLRDINKGMSLLQWLSQLGVDFVCLQEVHTEASPWFAPYCFLVVSAPGTSHSGGSIILYWSCAVISKSWVYANGRFLMAKFVLREVRFRVACIYAPNRNPECNDLFSDCTGHVDPSVPTLGCGDFNCVFDCARDRRGSDNFDVLRESHLALQGFFEATILEKSVRKLASLLRYLPSPPNQCWIFQKTKW